MIITYYGLSSFKISSGDFTLVTSPFSKQFRLTPPRMQTDVAVISNLHDPAYNNYDSLGGEETFVIDGPGEFDVKNLFVQGIAAGGDEKYRAGGFDHTTIYSIRMEDIRIGFLGGLKQKELTDEQSEKLGEIDVLFIPVGGDTVCEAESAVNIANQAEPRIVIPMHFADKKITGLKLDKLDNFIKEIGAKTDPQEKLTIKKADFGPEEKTETVILKF